MKKILGLAVAALLVMGLVGGGTWAYFSDTETSTGNVFTAGTLDLGLDDTSDNTSTTGITTAVFTSSNWAPGQTTATQTLYVNNKGSIDMNTVTVDFDYTAVDDDDRPANITDSHGNNPGTTWDAAGGTDNFDEMIVVHSASWNSVAITGITADVTTLADLKANGPYTLSALPDGLVYPLAMTFTFDEDATNGCQGNEVIVTVIVAATQD